MDKAINECKNCNTLYEGNYCKNCGQKASVKRFTLSHLFKEFLNGFFHVKNGLLFTIKELFIHPGAMLRGYIAGKRIQYFNPFAYLMIISLAGGYLYTHSGIGEHLNSNFLISGEIINFTSKHYNYRMLLCIPTYAITCWILYKPFKYNFAEQLIVNTFLISQSVVIMLIWLLISTIAKPEDEVFNILYISAFISIISYQVVVISRLFKNKNSIIGWIKAFFTVVTGLSLSFVVMYYLLKLTHIF